MVTLGLQTMILMLFIAVFYMDVVMREYNDEDQEEIQKIKKWILILDIVFYITIFATISRLFF